MGEPRGFSGEPWENRGGKFENRGDPKWPPKPHAKKLKKNRFGRSWRTLGRHLGKSKESFGNWVLRSSPLTLYGVHDVGLQASEVFGCCFAHLAVKKLVHNFPASLA